MDVYIKLYKAITKKEVVIIYLKDICDVICDTHIENNILNLEILKINDFKKKAYVVSAFDIIKKIKQFYKDAKIISIGEQEILINYFPKKVDTNKTIEIIKVCISCLILFAGSATAIMSYHNEAQLGVIFKKYQEHFFKTSSISYFSIPYSLGLFFGIVIFFNHFLTKKFTNDPTPIEVELSSYNEQVENTTKEVINNKK